MGIRSAWLGAFVASVLATEATALACNPLDANCNPPPPDPCLAPYGGTSDYNLCLKALPACKGLTGPPLDTCLYAGVEKAKSLGTATTTSTSTSTGTSTGTSTAKTTYLDIPNPSLYDPQVSENLQSGNINVTLDVSGNPQVTENGGTFLSQKDALNAQSQMLMACTITNLAGRDDGLCATNPNQPECTGMTAALLNATTCLKKGPVDPKTGKATCVQFGSFGYNIDEWLVFGQQYYNGMTGCFAVGDAGDTTGVKADPDMVLGRANRMQALSDFATFPPQGVPNGVQGTSASTITGDAKKVEAGSAQTVRWKAIADKVDDGAAYLGLERGDLIKAAAAGQTFLSAFTASPFAEGLIQETRTRIETALADPAETIDKAKEKSATMVADGTSGSGADGSATASLPGRSTISGAANPAAEGARAPASGGAVSRSAVAVAAGGGGAVATSPTPSSSLADKGAPLAAAAGQPGSTVRDRERELSDARALFGASPKPRPGALAPVVPASPELGTLDSSLFERVSRSYRRHTPALKAFDESKTARDVRNTEQPAFFKDL